MNETWARGYWKKINGEFNGIVFFNFRIVFISINVIFMLISKTKSVYGGRTYFMS